MNKIITVCGNAGSGKTLFSYFLANQLAKDEKRVIIIGTKTAAPDFPYILEPTKEKKSLGRLLSSAVIDQKIILENMHTVKSNSDIGILSYAIGEGDGSYPEITQASVKTLFEHLALLVDFIIIDAGVEQNRLDKYSLENGHKTFCITTANLKGLAFREVFQPDKDVTQILFADSAFNPYEDIKSTFKIHVKYEMPYINNLQNLYNGMSLDDLDLPKKYKIFLNEIIKKEFSDD